MKKQQFIYHLLQLIKTGPKHIEQDLTREVFEKLCENLINRCRIPVEKALSDARLDKSDINEVVLVGGSNTYSSYSKVS